VFPTTARSSFEVLPAERSFRLMGTDAHVVVWQDPSPVVAPEDLLDEAQARLERLESCWSRFLPTSDVCRMNEAPGQFVTVTPETIDVLEWAERFRRWSGGLFDATLLRELELAGYDCTFDVLARRASDPSSPPVDWRDEDGGDHSILFDRQNNAVASPPARGVDLGGIGKGRAADLVAAQLVQNGALGACVNIGGDLRVIGETPAVDGIAVAVQEPFDPLDELTLVEVRNAAVATSARTRRTWLGPDGPAHHLIDPHSRRPAASPWVAVTAIAPTATLAEVIAKVSFLGGDLVHPDTGEPVRAPRLFVAEDGSTTSVDGFGEYER